MNRSKYNLALMAVALLTAAACSKSMNMLPQEESSVRFEVEVDGTKAMLINNDGAGFESFKTNGFSVTAYEGTQQKMNKVSVTNNGTVWTYTGEYLWRKFTTMNFFAFYPKALASSLSTSNTGISAFSYSPLDSESATVKGQTDYMLATYNGTGNDGVAPLAFIHPLASVNFVVGNISGNLTSISNIAIGGFYKTATCTPSCQASNVTCTWSNHGGYATGGALSQRLNPIVTDITEDVAVGEPFLLIPGQTFSAAHPLAVYLTVTIDGVARTVLADITGGSLEQGKTTTFAINYEGGDRISFSPVSVTAWGTNAGGSADAVEKLPYVEIGGIKWATKNLEAKRETDYGAYAAWGAPGGFKPTGNSFYPGFYWSNAPFNNGSSTYDETYFNSVKNTVYPGGVLALEYDAAYATLGGNWRLPTMAEFKNLSDNTNKTWQTDYHGHTGVNGLLFTSKDDPTISIFLPAAGDAQGANLVGAGTHGYYLSSTLSADRSEFVYTLTFTNTVSSQYTSRFCGFAVRPVYDDTE